MRSTYIFMVPLGPRLVFITSCKPFDADIFMANASAARANSALGFNKLIDDIFIEFYKENTKANTGIFEILKLKQIARDFLHKRNIL